MEAEAEKDPEANLSSHPNAREPANNTVQSFDTRIREHQANQRKKIQKKYNASHKIVIFKEGDYATLKILKDNRAPTNNLQLEVKILEVPKYS